MVAVLWGLGRVERLCKEHVWASFWCREASTNSFSTFWLAVFKPASTSDGHIPTPQPNKKQKTGKLLLLMHFVSGTVIFFSFFRSC